MSRTTFYSVNYIGYPPVHVRDYANPNSAHWAEEEHVMWAMLKNSMTQEEWLAWTYAMWPTQEDLDNDTHKGVWEKCYKKFHNLETID